MGNGPHAGTAPGGVEIHHNDLALDVGGGDAAIDPVADVEGGHGFAFERGVPGSALRLVVPSPVVGKFAGTDRRHGAGDGTDGEKEKFLGIHAPRISTTGQR